MPPANLSTIHDEGFTLFLFAAKHQAVKLYIPIFIVFGLILPGIEPESTVLGTGPQSTLPLIG